MSTPTIGSSQSVPGANLAALLAPYRQNVVWTKNTTSGPMVFTADATRSDGHVVWQGANDPNGQDIQVVPVELLQNVQFQRSLQLGLLTVVDDPATQNAALAAQQQAWGAQEDRRQHPNPEAIYGEDGKPQTLTVEKADENDMLVLDCLEKARNCDQRVSVRRADLGKKAPLCRNHFGLAGSYVGMEDHQAPLVNGKAQIKWVRPQLG
jgi:hypothetical protein